MFKEKGKTNPENTFRLGALGFCFGKVQLLRISEEFSNTMNQPPFYHLSTTSFQDVEKNKINKQIKTRKDVFPNVYKLSVFTIANESVCPD
ncbi:hypothetical protein CEXT_416581 [Caerostris extrusa]|uniref:Uncharacterized protein n=1 Tax=Caerostris extrusa TaxID=172846 RepID=A0AAV4XWW2_CAEEX|nr:hypothetical protein CEXT_416581 [Caerostris extrusa]